MTNNHHQDSKNNHRVEGVRMEHKSAKPIDSTGLLNGSTGVIEDMRDPMAKTTMKAPMKVLKPTEGVETMRAGTRCVIPGTARAQTVSFGGLNTHLEPVV